MTPTPKPDDLPAKLRDVAEAARSLLSNSAWSVPSKELVDLQASLAALDAEGKP